MPSAPTGTTEELISWASDNDFSSLACQAAIELDNLIIRRETKFDSLKKLAEKIKDSIHKDVDEAPSNATAVVVMKRAIRDSNWSNEPITKLEDLIIQAKQISTQLSKLAEQGPNGETVNEGDPVNLRLFCVTLSKLALASERSRLRTKPDHPFRR